MEILDWSTIVLLVFELSLIIPALAYSVFAISKVGTHSCLHFPFRGCLIIICLRIYPHSIQFGIQVITQVFFNGAMRGVLYQSVMNALEILEVYCTAYAQLALAIERIIAILDKKYERRMAQLWKKVLLLIVLYLPGLYMAIIFTVMGYHSTGKTARILLLVAFFLSFSTLLITFRKSRKTRIRRHKLRLELDQRFATQENLKASSLYLPILVNELVCEVIKTCLVYFAATWTKTAYFLDIITAFQCLFYSSFLYHRHKRLMSKSTELSIFASPQATENYFSSYNAAWK